MIVYHSSFITKNASKSFAFMANHPSLYLVQHAFQLLLIAFKLLASLYDEAFAQPIFMQTVYVTYVIHGNIDFLGSASLFYSFHALLRRSPQINMVELRFEGIKLQQGFVHSLIQLKFHLVHFALFVQQFSKNLSIPSNTSLREENLTGVTILVDELAELIHAGDECKVLKCISPSVGVLVICVEKVEGVYLLPNVYGFWGNDNLRHFVAQQFQKCGFSTANISLN